MSESATSEGLLTPASAVQTLDALEGLEDTLSIRAAAVSWMIFGIAGGAIFLTYGTMAPWLASGSWAPVLAILWAPWIIAASIATDRVWKMMSASVDATYSKREGILTSVLGSLTFLAIAATLWFFLDRFVGLQINTHVLMTAVVGIFTASLALVQARIYCAPKLRVPYVMAGAGMVGLALLMGTTAIPSPAAALLGALGNLGFYFAASLYTFKHG